MSKPTKLAITLKRGLIGENKKIRNAVKSLGLRRRHHTVVRDNTPQTLGIINKIKHMVDVTDIKKV